MQIKTKIQASQKLAILLLCLVVIELCLMSGQVESVKSLKKKILLKKFKKLLPLLALVKPKKKILLLPIPFPMFNKHGNSPRPGPNMMVRPSSNQGAFMVVDPTPAQQAAPMMMLEPALMNPSSQSDGPSMTMTISSLDPGAMSSIELNTNMMALAPVARVPSASPSPAPMMSAPLIQQQAAYSQPQPQRLISRPISSVQYVEPTTMLVNNNNNNQYPYQGRDCDQGQRSNLARRLPLLSPAKLFRSAERYQLANKSPTRQQQQQLNEIQQQAPIIIATRTKQAPLVTINHNWRPSGSSSPAKLVSSASTQANQQQQQNNQIQQQVEQHLEMEDLVSVGPPQLIPVYQTANGRLHMTPPPQQTTPATPASTPLSTTTTSSTTNNNNNNHNLINAGFDSESSPSDDLNSEVRFVGTQANADLRQPPTNHSANQEIAGNGSSKPTLLSGTIQGPRAKSQTSSLSGGY